MVPLAVHVFEDIDATSMDKLADWSVTISNAVFTTNEHGFESFRGNVRMAQAERMIAYERFIGAYIGIWAFAEIVWEGRIEDIALTATGIQFTAFGYSKALNDVFWTGIWTLSQFEAFKSGSRAVTTSWRSDRWELDNVNHLYFAPREGENYVNNGTYGVYYFQAPRNADKDIKEVYIEYTIDLPTDWKLELISAAEGWTSVNSEWTFTSVGSPSTSTQTITLSTARPFIAFRCYNSTGSNTDYTSNTGANYAQITLLEVRGISGAVSVGDVLGGSATQGMTYVVAQKTNLNSSTILLSDPGQAVTNIIYEDVRVSDVFREMADLGDGAGSFYTYRVFENLFIEFNDRKSLGKVWGIDVEDLSLRLSVEKLANSVYATYLNDDGRVARTTFQTDDFSIIRYKVRREAVAKTQVKSSTVADDTVTSYLNEHGVINPDGSFSTNRVFTEQGAQALPWQVRAGDEVFIRNLPATAGSEIDKLASFRLARTSFSLDTGIITLVPEFAKDSIARSAGKAVDLTGRGG